MEKETSGSVLGGQKPVRIVTCLTLTRGSGGSPLPAFCIHQMLFPNTSVRCSNMRMQQQPRQKHQVQGPPRKSLQHPTPMASPSSCLSSAPKLLYPGCWLGLLRCLLRSPQPRQVQREAGAGRVWCHAPFTGRAEVWDHTHRVFLLIWLPFLFSEVQEHIRLTHPPGLNRAIRPNLTSQRGVV